MPLRNSIKTAVLAAGAFLHRNHRSKLLYYHDVFGATCYTDMGTPLPLFRQHLDVIREEGYRIVPRIMAPDGEVALLFDDGWRGIYDVREFFYERHLQPTVFLAVELIGKPGYLSKQEILELQAHGFIFECHAWSHQDLTLFNAGELARELGDSKKYLSDLLGKEVTEICLPIGYYSDDLLGELKKYEYQTVYSSVPGNYDVLVGGMMRSRNLVQYADRCQLRLILQGGLEWMRGRYERMHHRK